MEDQLFQVTENAWAIVLGLPLGHKALGEPPSENSSAIEVEGSVKLFGKESMTLVIGCSEQLARRAASIMFALPEREITKELCDDALGELANIVGGKLKAVLPDDIDLSPPKVREAGTEDLGIDPSTSLLLECEGSPVSVQWYKR